MSDAAPPNTALVERFAALVALAVERPQAAMELREAAKAVVEAAKPGPVTIALADGQLTAGGAPVEQPLLALRFAAYGLEALGLTKAASQADLLDLARLLAAPPGEGDPPARFAARAAVLDPKALPRTLRPRAEPAVEPPTVPSPRQSVATPSRLTPATPAQVAPAQAAVAAAPAAPDAPAPPPPRVSVEAPVEPRDAPERVARPLPLPRPSHHAIAVALNALELAESLLELTAALDQLVVATDLAFRQGRDADLLDGLTILVAVEFEQLARDGADERRQMFNHAVRRLARPVLLRQLAVLRHERADDARFTEHVQQALYRFGTDAAEALIDEHAAAPTLAARAHCAESLRGIRRTFDALHGHVRDQRPEVVREACQLMGELRDARGEPLLVDLLQHPDARVRRDAVAALSRFDSESAQDAIAFALNDESPAVRQRAIAALAGRRTAAVLERLAGLLDREPDRETLYAAIGAVGGLATAEAVQLLVRVAEGEGAHPLRKSAGVRIQACIALVTIRTPTAMAAVQQLRDDKDREVREASVRLVARATRRTTSTSIAAVPG